MARHRATGKTNVDAQHSFALIPSVKMPRSVFNRSCGTKTTFDAGLLIPVFVDEALPGDTMSMQMASFARMATPLHPVMDNMHLDVFFFSVPLRIIWDNFKRFMGEEPTPGASTDFTVPIIQAPTPLGHPTHTLHDYLGVPTGVDGLSHSALFARAYGLIYDDWFRDENLQQPWVQNRDDGPDAVGDVAIYNRGKRHDYFTSCLPFPQKGDPVTLSFGSTAPISSDATQPDFAFLGAPATTYALKRANNSLTLDSPPAGTEDLMFGDNTGLVTDLSLSTGTSINAIREAFQIQRLMERDARGGTRYTEIIRSHFGVTSPDSRMQRPEYLGGGTSKININVVPQTSETATTEQGNLAAYVTQAHQFKGWSKSFTEHSIILGIVSVRADINYQQGLNRMFSRESRFDFYWPSFAHLGEQAVLNKEIFAQGVGDLVADKAVFGYQERYAEYRYKPSQITGKFRSTDPAGLDTWHLAQEFSALPVLGDAFIIDEPPIDRVIAVPSEPHFLFDAFFDYRCVRPMPTYGVPGLIDHF